MVIRGDQVSQDFGFRSLCQPNAFDKHSSIVRESLGDIARTRADRVAQLVDTFVMPSQIGRQQEQIDAEIEMMRELPRRQVTNIVPASMPARGATGLPRTKQAKSSGFQREVQGRRRN